MFIVLIQRVFKSIVSWNKQDELVEDMVIVKFLVAFIIQFSSKKCPCILIFSGETGESKINYLLHSDYFLINEPLICTDRILKLRINQ